MCACTILDRAMAQQSKEIFRQKHKNKMVKQQ